MTFPNYDAIKGWFNLKLWTADMVAKAVELKVITAEQYKAITGDDYQATVSDSTAATSGAASVTPTSQAFLFCMKEDEVMGPHMILSYTFQEI